MSELRSLDPATGELVGTVAVTPPAELEAIVAAARAAQPEWQALGMAGRSALLAGAAERLASAEAELATLITREMGKPLREASSEVRSCARTITEDLEEIAAAVAIDEKVDARTRSYVFHDPLGVCAAITPWNFPLSMPHWMVFPALATGNAVILKPSELTPLCGRAYVDVLAPLLPPGVLQIVQGADVQGSALVAADVDLIAFTGSRSTGKKIFAAAASGLKRMVLELGGKDPLIVMADANLTQAARFAASSSFRNAGQVCVSTERILVPAALAEKFTSFLCDEAKELKIGNGMDPETRLGPMVSEEQRRIVLAQIDDAVSKGATIAYRGADVPERGHFLAPTVLTGVTDDMIIAREETFGPVACVTPVADVDEAVATANRGRYGLGAVVFGTDERAASDVGRRLQAGMIGINRSVGGAQGTPWVGARESGYGFHGSRDGHRQFTQTRILSVRR